MKITPEQIADLRRRWQRDIDEPRYVGDVLVDEHKLRCQVGIALLDEHALLCEVADAVIASRMEAHDFTDRLDRALDALRKARG
jgi:hypothetical protein